MIEVKASNTRKKFMCSAKDKIMYNGSCYQLITQSFYKDWCDLTPVISRTEFNRLMKMGVLGEPYKQKRMYVEMTMYDFIKETAKTSETPTTLAELHNYRTKSEIKDRSCTTERRSGRA